MKRHTSTAISSIRACLNEGMTYCGIKNNRGDGVIYVDRFDHNYIKYRRYGSSAIKNNNKELRWLLETIFKDCECVTPAKWSDYHVNFIPIASKYEGIDLNREHRKRGELT